jgi:hypothetical protein
LFISCIHTCNLYIHIYVNTNIHAITFVHYIHNIYTNYSSLHTYIHTCTYTFCSATLRCIHAQIGTCVHACTHTITIFQAGLISSLAVLKHKHKHTQTRMHNNTLFITTLSSFNQLFGSVYTYAYSYTYTLTCTHTKNYLFLITTSSSFNQLFGSVYTYTYTYTYTLSTQRMTFSLSPPRAALISSLVSASSVSSSSGITFDNIHGRTAVKHPP